MPKKSKIEKEYESLEGNIRVIAEKEIEKIEKDVEKVKKEAEKVGEEIESSMTEKSVKSKKSNMT
jgi:acetylornithine deacetylase/succinyl-diaminopimelate desuccinylase-like protein